MATRAGPEAAGEPRGPAVQDGRRRLRSLLEARQRHLRARIAACEELMAEMAALQAALRPCPSPGETAPAPAPRCSPAGRGPGAAQGSPEPGGGAQR